MKRDQAREAKTNFWWWAAVSLVVATFFLQLTNFTASDLGRHLANGRLILEEKSVFGNNRYSYTHSDFTVTNHHWGFGVLVYVIYQLASFEGITVFISLLTAAAIFLMTQASYWNTVSWRALYQNNMNWRASRFTTLLALLIVVPLFTARTEARPEILSLFLVAVFYWTLTACQLKKIPFWATASILLPAQVLWVNTHLFFPLGLLVWGWFALNTLLSARALSSHTLSSRTLSSRTRSLNTLSLPITSTKRKLKMFALGVGLVIATLTNPLGLTGALEPLTIFENYGYQVAENQSILFFWQRGETSALHWYVVGVIALGIVLIGTHAWQFIRQTQKSGWATILVGALVFMVGSFFAFDMIRLIPFWGIISLPVLALLLGSLPVSWTTYLDKWQNASPPVLMTSSIVGFGLLVMMVGSGLFVPRLTNFGLGLSPGAQQAGLVLDDLLAREQAGEIDLGKIFNNYDVGGYLIYHLYPTNQVFVDNRPEAYPAEFFTNYYIKAQEDDQKWQQLVELYDLGLIVFYRHDLTPWGQNFLIQRVQDQDWAPIFVDNYMLIMIKDKPQNRNFIEEWQLPREIFVVSMVGVGESNDVQNVAMLAT